MVWLKASRLAGLALVIAVQPRLLGKEDTISPQLQLVLLILSRRIAAHARVSLVYPVLQLFDTSHVTDHRALPDGSISNSLTSTTIDLMMASMDRTTRYTC